MFFSTLEQPQGDKEIGYKKERNRKIFLMTQPLNFRYLLKAQNLFSNFHAHLQMISSTILMTSTEIMETKTQTHLENYKRYLFFKFIVM